MGAKDVLVLGGGYGGLACLRGLRRRLDPARYRVTLIDAAPHHSIKTRFHERAVKADRDPWVRWPLAPLAEASGAAFLQDRVEAVDFRAREVRGRDGTHPYDRLVIALGGRIAHFGIPGAPEHTVSLQTYEQAAECCRRLAELGVGRVDGLHRRVVVVGAGIEGLEVATMIRQAAPPAGCAVTIVERDRAVIARSQCGDAQRRYILRHLETRRIGLRLGSAIREVTAEGVVLDSGEEIPADLVVWCSGVRRAEVGGLSPGEPFAVTPALQHGDHPEVFALGDFATVSGGGEYANLASAQRAVYMGALAAENLWRTETLRSPRPVRYRPIGEMIALGDFDAVGRIYGLPVHGAAAAVLKRANEWKYLAELHRDLPRSFLRGLGASEPAP